MSKAVSKEKVEDYYGHVTVLHDVSPSVNESACLDLLSFKSSAYTRDRWKLDSLQHPLRLLCNNQAPPCRWA